MFSIIPTSVLSLLLAWCLVPLVHANSYFVVTEPTQGALWTNGMSNHVAWTKGLLDGLDTVDVEMSRLSQDGLIFVASSVPTKGNSLNIFLQDIPVADDYYLLFLNSTHGIMYAHSQQFSVAASGNGTGSSDPTAPTVTVSGAPNPTAVFATTFPPSSNGVANPGWRAIEGSRVQIFGVLSVMVMCLFGGVWTVL